MDIIDHIGTVSGIDTGIYGATDVGTAPKVISLARYLLATNGQSLPGILTWQFNHPLPYAQGLSEAIYHNLFVQVGCDESLQQNFFKSRCEGLGKMSIPGFNLVFRIRGNGGRIIGEGMWMELGSGCGTLALCVAGCLFSL